MQSKTLKENKDFRRLYYRGKSKAGPTLVTYVMKNNGGFTRFGITTGKKVGNAVKRNRARRVIKAAFETLEGDIRGSYDIVFVARGKTSDVKMQVVQKEMRSQFHDLGLL